ncbi:MAG: DUF4397 domain-containing protein [Chitinophagales bacterium]|nr:DUF4397 domain-containing protein [Chitinophagales bacterium]
MQRILTFFAALVITGGSLFAQTANVQIVHNSPDPLLDSIDVYVNSTLSANLTNFNFREITPFLQVPAGVAVSIVITNTGTQDTLAVISYPAPGLTSGANYIFHAIGVANPANFDPNPDGLSTSFSLVAVGGATTTGAGAGTATFLVAHGVTDAPFIDVRVKGPGVNTWAIDNLKYGDFTSGYLTVPASEYIIEAWDSGRTTLLKSFYANLSSAAIVPGGAVATVFASGFVDPSQGPEFNLHAGIVGLSPTTGPSIPFRIIKTSTAQFIHNAADPAVDTVDIYLVYGPDSSLIAKNEDVVFRTASTVGPIPSNVPLKVFFAPKNSTSIADGIATIPINPLITDGDYVFVANGVVNTANFVANPDGQSIAFGVLRRDTLTKAGISSNVDVLAFHGSTDAPTVDIESGGVTLVDDASYGAFAGYLNVPAASYTLDVTDETGATTIASYTADLSAIGGQRVVVFASGFLADTLDQDANFGLWATLEDGTTFELPIVSSVDELAVINGATLYPNPASSNIRMNFSLVKASNVQYRVLNTLGQAVINGNLGQLNAGENRLSIDVDNLNTGMYLLNLVIDGTNVSRTFLVD